MGWSGLDNGALLTQASDFAVFVTADRGIEHQQNLDAAEVGVVLLVANSNRMEAYLPLADGFIRAVKAVKRGELIKVTA